MVVDEILIIKNCIAPKCTKITGFIDQFYYCVQILFHRIFVEFAFDSFLSLAVCVCFFFQFCNKMRYIHDFRWAQNEKQTQIERNGFDEFLVGRCRIFTTRTLTAAISLALTSIPIESMSWLQFRNHLIDRQQFAVFPFCSSSVSVFSLCADRPTGIQIHWLWFYFSQHIQNADFAIVCSW